MVKKEEQGKDEKYIEDPKVREAEKKLEEYFRQHGLIGKLTFA